MFYLQADIRVDEGLSDDEGNKVLAEELKSAGFDVVEENIKSSWNPEKEDFDQAKGLIEALLK